MEKIVIKKNVAMPENIKGRPAIYPFRKMDVGDCFDIEGYSKCRIATLHKCAKQVGVKISIRKNANGFTVWVVDNSQNANFDAKRKL